MLGISGKSTNEEKIVTVLDIGSSKICCMVVALAPWAGRPQAIGDPVPARLLGVAHQRSKGIKAGVVTDLSEAEEAIRASVSRAERMAGLTADKVIVSVSCGRLQSANFTAKAKVGSGTVTNLDVERVLAAGRRFAESDSRRLLQMNGLGYRLDDIGGIRNPRGMNGARLSIDLHAVTADEAPLRNLARLIDRCHLSVGGLVASPYASGLAVINEEEARLGVACIDLGGGTTTLSVFTEGHFVYTDAVALGGSHISFDIARALSTPLYEAERIKTLYGTLVGASSDVHEMFSYPVIGQDEVGLHQSSRARLREIMLPRVEETLGLVRDRLDASGFAAFAGQRVVLTGGASQLTGFGEFAAQFFGKAVRVGRPAGFGGATDSVTGPAFATTIGLLHALIAPGAGVTSGQRPNGAMTRSGYLGRVGQWFRESFWEDEQQAASGV